MIIFDNLDVTGTFSVVLRDKREDPNETLYLKIYKQDSQQVIFFALNNESTSSDYYTFTIPTDQLDEGQYIAYIYEGIAGESETCYIGSPTAIILGTWFECDPLTVEAVIVMDEEVVVGDLVELNDLIYTTLLRVDGVTYNTVYRNEGNQYTTYNE